jgi:hypothetical protein
VPRAVNQLALAVARVRQRLRAIVVVQAATCLAVLGGGAALSPRFGVLAVGISWAAGQTLVAVGVLAVLPRWLRGPAPARVVPVAARAVEVAG